MIICLFRKKYNPRMHEQILLNKMIKYPGTDRIHFESTFKTNQKYPNNPQLLWKVVACFTITRNLAVTTDATVNNLIADLYLRGICIMEERFDFFTEHTRWIFLIRLKNVKMTKKIIFYIFSSSAKTPLIRVKCQLFKKILISRPDSFFIILWFKKKCLSC